MKTLLFSLFLMICCTFAKAQLANTKWGGEIMAPGSTPVILDFKKDSVNVISKDSKEVIESMTYSIKNDVITLVKVSGGSPCEAGSSATVKFAVKDNLLSISVIEDACAERASAWPAAPFKKE